MQLGTFAPASRIHVEGRVAVGPADATTATAVSSTQRVTVGTKRRDRRPLGRNRTSRIASGRTRLTTMKRMKNVPKQQTCD